MKRLALTLFFALSLSGATPDNDASCDIGFFPAATLLLPYFEVDLDDPHGETTLFTVTNVTSVEQIAHVTLWTDYAFPVLDFDLFLTGYDMQSINLYDVIAAGRVAPPLGTGYQDHGTPEGDFSSESANPLVDELTCRELPMDLGADTRERLRRTFTRGIAGACETVGGVHENAIGYVTIDVVRTCNAPHAQEPGFIDALLFDNVLTGEYQQVNAGAIRADGAPLVHIRAIPEGGGKTDFARTFYSTYQTGANRTRDARQPLPSTFAARTTGKMNVWRESDTGIARACDVYPINGELQIEELVHFDDDGNAIPLERTISTASMLEVNGDGWVYLDFGAQAWVAGATPLGNGCSPSSEPHAPIAPAPNLNAAATTTNNDDTCDIAVLPAATLLLPYFDVSTTGLSDETTLVSLTNVTAGERIAHVTLWTDYAYPVVSFDVVLGGYDMRHLDLRELLFTGHLGASCPGAPSTLPPAMLERVVQALTTGRIPGDAACNRIGSSGHREGNAIGYATIDLVTACTSLNATNPEYFSDAIAFDNVLTGDYEKNGVRAPLVHIRAIPEGRAGSAFEPTFYARFTNRDARQPLPSLFAARWIDGGFGSFETHIAIWREAVTGSTAACAAYGANQNIPFLDAVTFDDEENPNGFAPEPPAPMPIEEFGYRPTGRWEVSDAFPTPHDQAVSGWIYLNLGDPTLPRARQAWVTSSMFAQPGFNVTIDATALGNGCTPRLGISEINKVPGIEIGPAPNKNEP